MTNDKKNVIWNIIGASTNAFNSLFFTIVVTRIYGINDAGIFTYCFATACLLYMIGVYAGRTFQVTDISDKNSDTDYIYHRIITCVIMMIVTLMIAIIKGFEPYKFEIFVTLCLFKCIEAFAESIYAIVQKNKQLYKVGISMFIKAIVAFVIFTIINMITKNLLLACISIVIVNIVFLILYDFRNIKKIGITKTKISKESIITLFKIGFFTFALTFLGNYLINVSRYAIDDKLTDDMQTIFGIIIMPATLMGLLGQYIIQPALIKISEYIKNREYNNLKNIFIKLVGINFALGTLILICACIFEVPILELIYGIELKPYFVEMIIIVIGSILYSLSTILSAILIAMRKTGTQTLMYFVTAIISTILAYILVVNIKIKGASITYFITMFIISTLFSLYTIYSLKKYKIKWEKSKGVNYENINNNSNI